MKQIERGRKKKENERENGNDGERIDINYGFDTVA